MDLFGMKLFGTVEVKLVWEIRDWWIGAYFGEFDHTPRKIWISLIPTLPICISWRRV